MSYKPTTWENGKTPVNADNLNKIEQGLFAASEGVSALEKITNQHAVEIFQNRATAIIEHVAETTPICVKNSAAGVVKLNGVHGKSEQESTKGYQLLDASRLATISKGGATVTNNGDGSFTISGSGTLTDVLSAYYAYSHEETIELFKSGNVSADFGTATHPYLYIKFIWNGGTKVYELNNLSTASRTFNLTEEIYAYDDLYMVAGLYSSTGNAITTGTIKPMLYQDGDGTWEKFSGGKPSPSPDYQQNTKPVVVSEIKAHGKNFVNPLAFTSGLIHPTNGELQTTGAWITSDYIDVDKCNTLAISSNAWCVRFAQYDGNKNFIKNDMNVLHSATSTTENTIQIVGKCRYIRISLGQTTDFATITPETFFSNYWVQIEDEVVTDYEPYTESVVKLSKPITLDGIGESADELLSGAKRFATYIFDGTETISREQSDVNGASGGRIAFIGLSNVIKSAISTVKANVKCTHYIAETALDTYYHTKGISVNQHGYIYIWDDNYTEGTDDFKAYLAEQYANGTPVTLTYELAEEVIEPLPEVDQIALHSLKSFDTVTYISTDSEVEPVIEMDCMLDTKKYIDSKFEELRVALVATGSEV